MSPFVPSYDSCVTFYDLYVASTGNSAYGCMLLDKTRHQDVRYVGSKAAACRAVNEPTFRKMTEIDDGYYELEMAKRRTRLDLPHQLGYWILQVRVTTENTSIREWYLCPNI